MDLWTTIRELDELISRTESVLNREAATLRALPLSRRHSEKQKTVRTIRAQLRRLRNQRSSITRHLPRQKIA